MVMYQFYFNTKTCCNSKYVLAEKKNVKTTIKVMETAVNVEMYS